MHITKDEFKKKLKQNLHRFATGEKGNLLEDCILGAPYKKWYHRAWDYIRMGWNICRWQAIWDGAKTFKILCGDKPLHSVGHSKFRDQVEVLTITCNVDSGTVLAFANKLPGDLQFFHERAEDFKVIYDDDESRITTQLAGWSTSALPCFQRCYIFPDKMLQDGEYPFRVMDGAVARALPTQLINYDSDSVPFVINLNESLEKRDPAHDFKVKPPLAEKYSFKSYVYNSFMIMLDYQGTDDVRYFIENSRSYDQYIEIKPSMQSSPSNRDRSWYSKEPMETFSFFTSDKKASDAGFDFGYDIVSERLSKIESENTELWSKMCTHGITCVMSGGGVRGSILCGAVYAFTERLGVESINALAGVSMGGVMSMYMADVLAQYECMGHDH